MRGLLVLVAAALLSVQIGSSCSGLAFSSDIQASQVPARQPAAKTNLCGHRAVLYLHCTALFSTNLL